VCVDLTQDHFIFMRQGNLLVESLTSLCRKHWCRWMWPLYKNGEGSCSSKYRKIRREEFVKCVVCIHIHNECI